MTYKKIRAIISGGGTGGHIFPAISIANALKEKDPAIEILFVGAQGCMEEQLVPKAGFALKCLEVAGLSRGRNWNAIKKNLKTIAATAKAVSECKKIIQEFQPDVILGTGGYACFPALMAGTMLGIPTCIHESNAIPGLTTKLLERYAVPVFIFVNKMDLMPLRIKPLEDAKHIFSHVEWRMKVSATPTY